MIFVAATVSNTRGIPSREEWALGLLDRWSAVTECHWKRTRADGHQVCSILLSFSGILL